MPYKERGTVETVPSGIISVAAYKTQCYKVGNYPTWYAEDDPDIFIFPYCSMTVDQRETIAYTTGRGVYNQCTHSRHIPYEIREARCSYLKSIANPAQMYSFPTRHDRVTDLGSLKGVFSFQGMRIGGAGPLSSAGLPSADWADLVGQVGSQLDGRMLAGQNLLVSFAQIAQTVGMFKNPGGLVKLAKAARKSKLPLGQLLKAPANGWLEYQFGWKNLYRDVEALASVWSEVRKHKQYLKSVEDKFSSVSARSTSKISDPTLSVSSKSMTGFPNGTITIVPKLKEIKAVNTFSLDIYREPGAAAWSTFDQVLSRLGIRGVAEALWDLVPFSFVVDWFTHVNRDIRRASIPWNAYKLRYVGYSRKIEWLGYLQITSSAQTYWGVSGGTVTTLPQVVQKTYARVPGFPPDTSSVGLFGSLSKTQLADLGALIVQRL